MRKKRLVLLFAVLLGVCGVMVWRYNASRESMDIHRKGYLNLTKVSDLNLEKEIERDLNICNGIMHMDDNDVSKDHQTLTKSLDILWEYIPANYSSKFRNPCWYDSHQMPTSPLIQTSTCTFQAPSNLVLAKRILDHVKNASKKHLYCLPAFFLPGFPKCATTALYKMIIQHPLVAQTRCKECGFWTKIVKPSDTDIVKRVRTLWYIDLFSQSAQAIDSNPQSITLDASVTYTHSTGVRSCVHLVLLKRVLPEARFILIMRNPSQRYFSHYWFITVKQLLSLQKNKHKLYKYAHSRKALDDFHKYTVDAITKFQSCVDQENSASICVTRVNKNDLTYSLYYYHIVSWLEVMSRERFLFLRTEDLAHYPFQTLSKVWHFLDIHEFTIADAVSKNVNKVTKGLTIPSQTKKLLAEFFQPYNHLLAHLLSDTRYLWND